MRKIDINTYSSNRSKFVPNKFRNNFLKKAVYFLKFFCIVLFRVFLSLCIIGVITGSILFASFNMYASHLVGEDISIDIKSSKLALTSFVYVNDEDGVPREYQRVYSSENRIWVDFKDIPMNMKNAVLAIEDKRFYEHHGLDFRRTAGAVVSMVTGSKVFGGSTLTQQLVKNITGDNEFSPKRKVLEAIRAQKIEQENSKDEILECYLNIVNFGGGAHGVQSASNLYFGKDIKDCTLAQCAAIAGITQNPTVYNPFNYPGNNKDRREIILSEMLNQEKISKSEYDVAMEESKSMKFVESANATNNDKSNFFIKNWYTEAMFQDIINDLCKKYNIGKSAAEDMLHTKGLKIYSAMDKKMQSDAEAAVRDKNVMPKDPNMELGFLMMDLDGRVLASIGSRKEKKANLLYDRANSARRQPGSTIKPLAAYTLAIDLGIYNYSSLIPDRPLQIQGKDWPHNWYGGYKGDVLLRWAIEKSANAPVAQLVNMIGTFKSCDFLSKKLGFTSLDSVDAASLSALAAGGTHYGVTVREMASAYQVFGNGGKFNKSFTYFYVEDKDGKVILDNRANVGEQAISSETATIMNRLLRNVIVGSEGTGRAANISGENIIGKTGTTTESKDSWFVGLSSRAVAAVWTGYDNPKKIQETSAAARIWKHMMSKYLAGKSKKDYNYSSNVKEAKYCLETGLLANVGCGNTAVGYYAPSNTPGNCNLHGGNSADESEEIEPGNEESLGNDVETNENTVEESVPTNTTVQSPI